MTRYNSGLLMIALAMIIALLMVGCSIPFLGDKVENGEETPQEPAQTITAKPEEDQPQQPVAVPDIEEEPVPQTVPGPKLTVNLPENLTTIHDKLQVSGSTASGSTLFVNGQTLRLRSDGSFTTDINLKAGDNIVRVISVDRNGNSTTVERRVIFDAGRPSLRVFVPAQSTSINVTVSGYTDPGCVVYINETKAKTDANGGFSGNVELKRQGDNTVSVVAVNGYGVSTTQNRVIRGVPPRLQVAAPDLVTASKATISGVADAGSTVVLLVGSKRVNVNLGDGTFSETVDLDPGLNDVLVMATNFFGTTERSLVILYDDYNRK